MLDFVAETARVAGLEDYRVLVNVGAGAGQTIFHLHWHVLGGRCSMPGAVQHEPDHANRGGAEGGDGSRATSDRRDALS